MRASKKDSSLKDRRAIHFDNVGISNNEMFRMENDNEYIPHPLAAAKIVEYFRDDILAKDICASCLISETSKNIKNNAIQETLIEKSLNTSTLLQKPSSRNISVNRRVAKELSNKGIQKSYFYSARLKMSLRFPEFSDRNNVCNKTGISYKVLSKIENDLDYIARFEDSDNLLRLYQDEELANKICSSCSVMKKYKPITEVKMIYVDQKKVEDEK